MHRFIVSVALSLSGCILTRAEDLTARGNCYGRHCGPHNLWPGQTTSQCDVSTVYPTASIQPAPAVPCHPWPLCGRQTGFSTAMRAKRTPDDDEDVPSPDDEEAGLTTRGSAYTIPGATIDATTISGSTLPATIVSVSTVTATTVATTTVPATTIYKTISRGKKPRPTHSGLDAATCDCSSLAKARLGGCEYFCSQTFDNPAFRHHARSEQLLESRQVADASSPYPPKQESSADKASPNPFEQESSADKGSPNTSEQESSADKVSPNPAGQGPPADLASPYPSEQDPPVGTASPNPKESQPRIHDNMEPVTSGPEKKKNGTPKKKSNKCKIKDFLCKAWYRLTFRPKYFYRCHHCDVPIIQPEI